MADNYGKLQSKQLCGTSLTQPSSVVLNSDLAVPALQCVPPTTASLTHAVGLLAPGKGLAPSSSHVTQRPLMVFPNQSGN